MMTGKSCFRCRAWLYGLLVAVVMMVVIWLLIPGDKAQEPAAPEVEKSHADKTEIREKGESVNPSSVRYCRVVGRVQPAAHTVVILSQHAVSSAQGPVNRRSSRLDGDGRFVFTDVLPDRTYQLEARCASYLPSTMIFTPSSLDSEGSFNLGTLHLRPLRRMKVRLVDRGNTPVTNGSVLVRETWAHHFGLRHLQRRWREARVDENGWAEVHLPAEDGAQVIVGVAPGYACQEALVGCPCPVRYVINMTQTERIFGTVYDGFGAPLDTASVALLDGRRRTPIKATTTDKEGRFCLPDILSYYRPWADPELEIEAWKAGHATEVKKWQRDGLHEVELWLNPETVVSGRVITEEEGEPLAGAMVLISHQRSRCKTTLTDEQGRFSFYSLASEASFLSFDHSFYMPLIGQSINLEAGKHRQVATVSLASGFAKTVRVCDASTGEPIIGACVQAHRKEDARSPVGKRYMTTSREGACTLKGLGQGKYCLYAWATGYVSSQTLVFDPELEKEAVEFLLERASAIRGKVTDMNGGALAQCAVSLKQEDEAKNIIRTDERGAFSIRDVTPGSGYCLHVSCDGFVPAEIPGITMPAGENVDGMAISLSRGGTVKGRVLDSRGRGVAGAVMDIMSEAEHDRYTKGVWLGMDGEWTRCVMQKHRDDGWVGYDTDRNGNYAITGLVAGRYYLSVQQDGHVTSEEKAVVVQALETMEGVDFIFDDEISMSGVVLDSEGNSIPEVVVSVFPDRLERQRRRGAITSTDKDGCFRIRGLPARAVHIRTEKRGYTTDEADFPAPPAEVTLVLERMAVISGTLVMQDGTSAGVCSVKIEGKINYSDSVECNSDSAGRFAASVAPGKYAIVVEKWWKLVGEDVVYVAVEPGERREVKIALSKIGSVLVHVVAEGDASPIQSARVSLEENVACTDENGYIDLHRLPEGHQELNIEHEAYAPKKVPVSIRAGKTTEVTIELRPAQGVRGKVCRRGWAVDGALVRLTELKTGRSRKTTTRTGSFELYGLQPGAYTVAVAVPSSDTGGGGIPPAMTILAEVPMDKVLDLRVNVDELRCLSGVVTLDGTPVGNVQVCVRWAMNDSLESFFKQDRRDQNVYMAVTDSTGRYRLSIPKHGMYTVAVKLAGDADACHEETVVIRRADKTFDIMIKK